MLRSRDRYRLASKALIPGQRALTFSVICYARLSIEGRWKQRISMLNQCKVVTKSLRDAYKVYRWLGYGRCFATAKLALSVLTTGLVVGRPPARLRDPSSNIARLDSARTLESAGWSYDRRARSANKNSRTLSRPAGHPTRRSSDELLF